MPRLPSLCLIVLLALFARTAIAQTKPAATQPVSAHEALVGELITSMEQMVPLLKSAVDVPSTKAAAPKLAEIGKTVQAIKTRGKELGDPHAEMDEKLQTVYMPRILPLMQAIDGELKRINANPELRPLLADVLPSLEVMDQTSTQSKAK